MLGCCGGLGVVTNRIIIILAGSLTSLYRPVAAKNPYRREGNGSSRACILPLCCGCDSLHSSALLVRLNNIKVLRRHILLLLYMFCVKQQRREPSVGSISARLSMAYIRAYTSFTWEAFTWSCRAILIFGRIDPLWRLVRHNWKFPCILQAASPKFLILCVEDLCKKKCRAFPLSSQYWSVMKPSLHTA